MNAKIHLGLGDITKITEVKVDGFDNDGHPFNICKSCGKKIGSSQYYEVGCECEFEDREYMWERDDDRTEIIKRVKRQNG